MRLIVGTIVIVFCLSACETEPPMIDIMTKCDVGTEFDTYVDCIKFNYKRDPDSTDVISFYAQLDAVVEDYKEGRLSQAKAKAQAFALYDATVGAGNKARAQRAAMMSAYTPPPVYSPRPLW